jgi:hypothetical protein
MVGTELRHASASSPTLISRAWVVDRAVADAESAWPTGHGQHVESFIQFLFG